MHLLNRLGHVRGRLRRRFDLVRLDYRRLMRILLLDLAELLPRDSMRVLLVYLRRISRNFIRVDVHDPRLLTGCIEVVNDERTGVAIVLLPVVGFGSHGPPA